MYVTTKRSNVKWGGTDFKWGAGAPLAPPLATALVISRQFCTLFDTNVQHRKYEEINE